MQPRHIGSAHRARRLHLSITLPVTHHAESITIILVTLPIHTRGSRKLRVKRDWEEIILFSRVAATI